MDPNNLSYWSFRRNVRASIARTLIDVGDNVTFDDLFDNDTESSIDSIAVDPPMMSKPWKGIKFW